MKKVLLTVFACLCFFHTNEAHSFVRYEEKKANSIKHKVQLLGYKNYSPLSWIENSKGRLMISYDTALQPMLDKLHDYGKVEYNSNISDASTDEMIQEIRKGKIDVFLGAYSQTEMFKGIHYIYPAAFINPITIFMLPGNIASVKSIEDLKTLKGVRNTNEPLSDFVNAQISKLNPIEVDSAYKAFEKLFTEEADYFITSFYNGMIEASRLGIKHQIAPAKQALWNIPVFIGVSKTSPRREFLSKAFTKMLTDPKMQESIKENINKIVRDFDLKYQGVVPVDFGQNKTMDEKPNKQLDGK